MPTGMGCIGARLSRAPKVSSLVIGSGSVRVFKEPDFFCLLVLYASKKPTGVVFGNRRKREPGTSAYTEPAVGHEKEGGAVCPSLSPYGSTS